MVAEVEARGRLVHHQHLRLLRDGARAERELPLSTADVRVRTIGQAREAYRNAQIPHE
jgi:hypothetical protein